MSALGNFSPTAATVVKLFAESFRSAPTADLVTWFTNDIRAGDTPAGVLNFLFNYPVPQSPFTAYASTTTNTAFATALVDNLSFGSAVSAATKAGWVTYLAPLIPLYPSRGDFTVMVTSLVDNYAGTDPDLLAVKAKLAERAETAAAFAQSPAGAVYNGGGFTQLITPLLPPPVPTYALGASAAAVDEGSSVTFTLTTTGVAAGTSFNYTLAGTGITTADVAGGQLAGTITVNTAGIGTATITLVNDATTEGNETLRLDLANSLGRADVVINDTSKTPVVLPTYALSSNVASQNEGGSIVYTLTTTNVAPGTIVTFTLAGAGVTPADVVGGVLGGIFTINDLGVGTATVGLVADASTEGTEVMRLQLNNGAAQVDTTINDTSITPGPAGTPDTLIIADNMASASAHSPATPLEGEIPFNSYLSYDLLNQRGITATRMSLAALLATNPVAGAPLDLTNQAADRGAIPQVSNKNLFTFDLGLLTDRVDYSAETGKIVAVVSAEPPAAIQYVIVNDNGVDNKFNDSTDRIDTLKNVEEIVASAGGGVLDLTASAQDLRVTFSRGYNAVADVDTAKDRGTHVVELADLNTGSVYGRSYLEFRDAGGSVSVIQPTAAWTTVQGSDRNETLIFTNYQSLDARINVLRGGTNTVKFNEGTRSILVDVAMTAWVPSNSPADDTNATGVITATTTFTNGDGVTPLSANTTVTSSNTPDNNISAGVLKITGTLDAEDTVSFNSIALPKFITLGQSLVGGDGASMRLVSGPATNALEVTGFEFLRDNGLSDDVYFIENILKALPGFPKLLDGPGGDHDTVRLNTEALGSAAVGGVASVLNLATLNGPTPGFGVDFDVLDLSLVTTNSLQAIGTAGTDDELVIGKLGTLSAVTLFESLVLTNASTDKGFALTFDVDAGTVKAGATTLFNYSGTVLSAGGLVYNTTGQASAVAPVSTGLFITVVDSLAGAAAAVWGGSAADVLTGGAGNDTLRGGAGNDTLDAGVPSGSGSFAESWAFTVSGTPDATGDAAHRIGITMTVDGTVLTLTEAAVADTAYGDGNGAVVDGSGAAAIGAAMAAMVNANIAAINAGPGTGTLTGASFNVGTGTVLLSYLAGVNASDVVSFVLNSGAGPDAGTFALSAGVNVNGSSAGTDVFVFEKTAVLNGQDTLLNFTAGSDKLDVKAFTGTPITVAGGSINASAGGLLGGVPGTAEFIYNKANAALSAADFAATVAAGKFVIPEGGKCVVAVTADVSGARGDAGNTAVSLYYVENGATPGLTDLSVALVGTISGPIELTLADIFAALS